MLLHPCEDQLAGLNVVRARHDVPARVPGISPGRQLRHRQVLHGLAGHDLFLVLPGVAEHPTWLAAGEGAKRVHANHILEPGQRRASRRSAAGAVLMRNRVNNLI